MPRILPWKRREQESPQTLSSARSSPVQRVKREDAKPVRDDEDSTPSPKVRVTTPKSSLKRPRRSTSTSPPPGPLEEKFMIEGIDGDDRYRMVEDEFLTTAQQFTAHLHAAEYKRLKAASELENAQMIKNISRPVVGPITDLVKIKREKKALSDKQRLAIRKLRKGNISGDESSGTEDFHDSWQQQSLHGLMESPGKRAKRLDRLPSATSVTRAAAGFNRQTSDIVSPSRPKPMKPSRNLYESEDDLEAQNSYQIAHRSPRPIPTSRRVAEPKPVAVSKPAMSGFHRAAEIPQDRRTEETEKTAVSDDEDMDFMARLKKRQAERRRSRGQKKSTTDKVKSDSGDILPDFL
ncbi:hypothetical protein NUW58_g3417 [Xylaria curta]|uniref:Uncharacterized protein n=1 Tax=Xylaria curta TaxID=42375 RepID=A0ACC1PC23_9PEZI|nr:hypothetical protein NUW58_g3417 [Xylaria curta]